MAKEVNLGRKPAPPPPADLLAKVTSGKKLPPPPQPKNKPAGITGDLPLPQGQVVGCLSPAGLTPAERETLESMGWTPDVPIPNNMAEILAEIQQERASEEVVLPIDPRTPPVKMDTQDISKVDPATRQRLVNAMRTAAAVQQAQAQQQAQASRLTAAAPRTPGLQDALNTVQQAQRRQQPAEDAVVDDRGGPPEDKNPPARPHTPEDAQRVADAPGPKTDRVEAASSTGADARPANCPHCGWDLSMPDATEPAYGDKMAFLHALLGQKPYVKEVDLFGGNVTVAFRTLTTREIDAVYKQAWRDKETGKVVTEVDYWEHVNRYRLSLQMLGLRSRDGAVSHDLPDGLSKTANPACEAEWKVDAAELPEGETALPLIKEWLVENVFKTEALFRVVANACNQFNRLVAKLEAMADNSDFWKPTEAQS